MKVKIHMHDKAYNSKPENDEIKKIVATITKDVVELEIDDFANAVGNEGRTFTPALFQGDKKKENFVCEQVYALDFDGRFTVEQFMERAEKYDVQPAFIYDTFNHTQSNPKFRAVFINDCIIYNVEAASILIQMLQGIFPESDASCKDVSRMFFGGKNLRLCQTDAMINLFDVSLSLQAYLRKKDRKNFARKIEQVGNKLGVEVQDNMLRIHRRCNSSENEDFCGVTSTIRVETQNSSLFYIIEKYSKEARHHICIRKSNECRTDIRGVTIEDLRKKCRLFRDFYEKELPHDYKFHLATNIQSLSNGQQIFFGGILKHEEKWNEEWKYMKCNHYKPQQCKKSGCPYYEECRSNTILDKITAKIQKIRDEKYIDLHEAEEILRNQMLAAVNEGGRGIYLISAQTALGKTHTYSEIVKNNYHEKAFMIVVPTIKLQEEVRDKLMKLDVPVFLTPNVLNVLERIHVDDLRERVEFLYKRGCSFAVKKEIKEYLKRNKDKLYEWQSKQLEKLLDFKKQLNGTRCIVTTHAMLLSLPEEIIKNYEIIVDEDILMTIFKNNATISFEEIESALEKNLVPKEREYFVQQLIESDDGAIIKNIPMKLETSQLHKIYDHMPAIEASLTDFLMAETYYIDVQNERVCYFVAKKIPNVKLTIVSATLNEELYQNYCKGRYICKLEVPTAKYKGKLEQYTAHSMSRSNMENIGLNRIEASVYKIIGDSDFNVITFKKIANKASIYYGKTEGFNEYKGKNLAVIGTPHNIPFVYRLIGAYLGYKANDTLSVRYAENSLYSFPFMTFKDAKMKNLQFYFIESEMEQAIGRARLLRYDCNVYLFANYPCRQANIIQDEYLIENM